MRKYEFFIASALEKVFPNKKSESFSGTLSTFCGTRASVQLVYIAYTENDRGVPPLKFEISFKNAPVEPRLRTVELIPSDFPCYEISDDNYLSKEPGLFPDLLMPLEKPVIMPLFRQYRSVFITFDIPESCASGVYDIELIIKPLKDEILPNGNIVLAEAMGGSEHKLSIKLNVCSIKLLPQKLIHTEWFHCDCLADYYGVEVFSEEHWQIIENFMSAAVKEHGINMILTPVFTPPLDTAIGTERPTVQLVDVLIKGDSYEFNFEKLHRWLKLCKKCGIEYIEISHLFTQWGAKCCPKVMARKENGEEIMLFGWHTPAISPKYKNFMQSVIPELIKELNSFGYANSHVYFHISDEPDSHNLNDYLAAKKQVEDLLAGCNIIDALSDFEFYKQGVVKEPIPANNHIQPFIDAKVPNLWTYYCCAQSEKVPNRFFAMPSARNRIMGALLFANNIKGFLHWGYNFYYGQYSLTRINPYIMTHANYAFPSGDGYLVYPGKEGQALSSIRAEVQYDALVDLRALETLKELKGADYAYKLLHNIMGELHFDCYPKEASKLLELREAVAKELK